MSSIDDPEDTLEELRKLVKKHSIENRDELVTVGDDGKLLNPDHGALFLFYGWDVYGRFFLCVPVTIERSVVGESGQVRHSRCITIAQQYTGVHDEFVVLGLPKSMNIWQHDDLKSVGFWKSLLEGKVIKMHRVLASSYTYTKISETFWLTITRYTQNHDPH